MKQLLVISYVQNQDGIQCFWDAEKWFDMKREVELNDIIQFMNELNIYTIPRDKQNFLVPTWLNDEFIFAERTEKEYKTEIFSINIYNENMEVLENPYNKK